MGTTLTPSLAAIPAPSIIIGEMRQLSAAMTAARKLLRLSLRVHGGRQDTPTSTPTPSKITGAA